jgi:hypothetical protein
MAGRCRQLFARAGGKRQLRGRASLIMETKVTGELQNQSKYV